MGTRESSEVKGTQSSCGGPRFGSQKPHGSLQCPVTSVSKAQTPSSGLHEHEKYRWYSYMNASKYPYT